MLGSCQRHINPQALGAAARHSSLCPRGIVQPSSFPHSFIACLGLSARMPTEAAPTHACDGEQRCAAPAVLATAGKAQRRRPPAAKRTCMVGRHRPAVVNSCRGRRRSTAAAGRSPPCSGSKSAFAGRVVQYVPGANLNMTSIMSSECFLLRSHWGWKAAGEGHRVFGTCVRTCARARARARRAPRRRPAARPGARRARAASPARALGSGGRARGLRRARGSRARRARHTARASPPQSPCGRAVVAKWRPAGCSRP